MARVSVDHPLLELEHLAVVQVEHPPVQWAPQKYDLEIDWQQLKNGDHVRR
jgi:hypothetical protein